MNDSRLVATPDACGPDGGEAPEGTRNPLILGQAALDGLADVAAGRVVDDSDLDTALAS